MAGPGPGRPVPRGRVADLGRVPRDLGSPAMADDQQPVRLEDQEHVAQSARLQPLEPREVGHGRESITGGELPR